jgi:peptide/nickel transport system permease protein
MAQTTLEETTAPTPPPGSARSSGPWRAFCRNIGAVVGAAILLVVVVTALFGPLLFPDDPWNMATRPFLKPFADAAHPFGSDLLGRDILTGIVYGARVSLLIGIFSTLAAIVIGVAVGALAGYFGGRVDDGLMRFTEFFQTIPSFLFAIVLVAILLPSFNTICLAIAIVSWPPVARLVRGEVLSLRSREFVLAAIVAGLSPWRIILGQILPNTLSPIIVTASMMVASAILLEGALSFLGLGDPNMMSWGFMVGAGRTVIRQAWWISFFPGLAIMLTVLALNLVGEGLNDALNPRQAREGR